jgi:hypothetical protein
MLQFQNAANHPLEKNVTIKCNKKVIEDCFYLFRIAIEKVVGNEFLFGPKSIINTKQGEDLGLKEQQN